MAGQYPFPVPIRKDALVRAHWMKEEDQLTERDLGFVRRGFRWALTGQIPTLAKNRIRTLEI